MQREKRMLALIRKLASVAIELENLADEVEAIIMKKTTQRSPEFRGGANC